MADINILNLVAQKKQASEQAVRAAAPVRGATDERGKVNLWLISQKRWAKFWPVDAMDILKSGTANLDGPEPEPEIVPEPEPAGATEMAVESMSIPQLKKYADEIGIVEVNDKPVVKMKRDELLDAIHAKLSNQNV